MTDIRILKTHQAIENAMSDLLKEKSFDHITTTELVKRAGISRSSFYTHYQDKYEMIDKYQSAFFLKLATIFRENDTDLGTAIYELFKFLDTDCPVESALLSENGTREIHMYLIQQIKTFLADVIFPNFGQKSFDQVNLDYRTTYLSQAIFGILQLWIKRGKQESPQEITDILMLMLASQGHV
ncbi:TetR/AcrR family transcriptional regulator [Lactococcus carnosus]|nr:TetR/AcrR family transcriptional regulator C-terminal domain-containing protein [Lactococcus carnosus]QDJ25673.1 TetR family transcriptional regulator [Lactococcus carnosus]SCA92365.1 Putative transcriptional regulator, TetR family (containing a DNA-binding HTH domain, TetR-type domain) [Lactococcus piscium]SOB48165.1 Transcriptional regulator, TetR family [Lactococcus piscium]